MSKTPITKFVLTATLALSTVAATVGHFARAEDGATGALASSGANQIPMRAVPGVNFDRWVEVLARGAAPGAVIPSAEQLSQQLRGALMSGDLQESYQALLSLASRMPLLTLEDHIALADALFEVRHEMRQSALSLKDRHQRMTLLQFLGEETLFVASQKFPEKLKEYLKVYAKIPDSVRGSIASGDLRGIEVMTGDVVLSKFSGTGSSSFIALSSNRPSLFSHSAAVYVDPSSRELLTPEAFIEDGVKIRGMQESYIDKSKTRMFVYRAVGSDSTETNRRLHAAANGVSRFIEDIQNRVRDPRTEAAFPYNFSMDPENGNGGYTCTETVLESYKRGGLTGGENAYAKSLWSSFPDANKRILSEFLEMKAPKFPAPGDLDMNPRFDLVGFRVDVEKLAQDRVEMAAIDSLLALIASNNQKIRERLQVFDGMGEKTITKEQLDFIKNLKVIPEEMRAKITTSVPANINIKQLVFFGYLNEVFTPQVREAMLKDAAAFQAANGRPPGLNELRGLAVRHTVEHIGKMKALAEEFARKAGQQTGLLKKELKAALCKGAFGR